MNPVLFTIFNIEIRYYSIFIMLGVIISISMLMKEGKRYNYPKDFLFNLAFWVLVFGIVGARMYYCLFNFHLYKDNLIDILKIWEGGLAIHGGIIAGFITLLIYTKKYNVSSLKMTDMAVVPLLLAQAIGRWGNFFNGEAHGVEIAYHKLKTWLIPDFVIEGMKIGNVYYHPTFYYESIYCLVGFIILLFVRRYKYLKKGQLTCFYLIYYSFGRFFIESLRTDSLMIGPFRAAQVVSIILFVIGIVALMIISRKEKFEDLYSEDHNGPLRF